MLAVYDLEKWQPTYTITIFLMALERARLKAEAAPILDVVIQPGVNGEFGPYKRGPKDLKSSRTMLENIVMPMVKMLPSVRSVTHLKERIDCKDAFSLPHVFSMRHFVDAYADGIRPLRVPNPELAPEPKLITMTLRECDYWPTRNSSLPQWHRAAIKLQKLGFDVRVVRDTANANFGLDRIEIDPAASVKLEWRAWLYRRAACNLFVSNGPAWFAMALDVPMLMFRPYCNDANKTSHESSLAGDGIIKGQQMQGAPAHQRLVWEPGDDERTLVEHTLQFVKDLS